jgi:Tol biopolymer transport system component
VLAGIRVGAWGGGANFAVSPSGTLAYVTGTEFEASVLIEVERSGRERRRFEPPGSYYFSTLSPDGYRLAASVRTVTNSDIYLVDLASGRFDRFSFDIAEDESPVWSPNGRQIAYSSAATGEQRHIHVKAVGSPEKERRLYTGKYHLHLSSWSPDGRWLVFSEFPPRSGDIWALNVDDTSQRLPIANTSAEETNAVFSPDGRWIAYNSNETQ